jgi:serine/threonine protein kinase
VALKLIAPDHTQDVTAVAGFKSEARIAASLEHPNIVPIHRGGEFEGVLYLAMRLVPGTNLREVMDQAPLDLDRTGQIVSDVARAFDVAPPARARPPRRQAGEHPALRAGRGREGVPHRLRSDQAARVARRPELWAHVADPPPLPRSQRPELVAAFDEVLAKATAKDPADRYATAGELAAAVRAAISKQRAPDRRPGAAENRLAATRDSGVATRDELFVGERVPPPPGPPPSALAPPSGPPPAAVSPTAGPRSTPRPTRPATAATTAAMTTDQAPPRGTHRRRRNPRAGR